MTRGDGVVARATRAGRGAERRVAVVGSGWTGATAARVLHDAGCRVEVLEAASVVGGHSRMEVINGVWYEPNGPHIFHTSRPEVVEFAQRFGMRRPFEHAVVSCVYLDGEDEPHYLSWPPQIDEIRSLPVWRDVERELAALPDEPHGDDFESYVVSMMGPTLYRLFVRDYTVKQWGCDPRELASTFAPKRVELRRDGYRRLFRDTWEFFPPEGVNEIIEEVLRPVPVTCGARITSADVDVLGAEYDALVLTAPLDAFVGREGALAWRGVTIRARYVPTDSRARTATRAYQVNHASDRVAYTRTVETKHASGQQIGATVVCEEYPGASARHYPVATVDRRYETANDRLKEEIRAMCSIPVHFCGRLANYLYINQDEAIAQGMEAARDVLERRDAATR